MRGMSQALSDPGAGLELPMCPTGSQSKGLQAGAKPPWSRSPAAVSMPFGSSFLPVELQELGISCATSTWKGQRCSMGHEGIRV